MRDGSYDVCKVAAKLPPHVVQKRMTKKTRLSQVQFKRPAAAAFKPHIKKLQKLVKSKGQQKVQTKVEFVDPEGSSSSASKQLVLAQQNASVIVSLQPAKCKSRSGLSG